MPQPLILALGTLSCVLLIGCAATNDSHPSSAAHESADLPVTQEEQARATPRSVLDRMLQGNARYVAGEYTPLNAKASRAASATGQYPLAYVLSCVDSRVLVEPVFDMGIGDVFVGRVAGNFENVDQLGSMEFATAAAGSKLVMVLGHQSCGAIKGAADGVELGNLTELLTELEPAVEDVDGHEGHRTSKNAAFIAEVVEANVRRTVEDIRRRSDVLAEREAQGQLMIVGAVYSLETGEVTLLD